MGYFESLGAPREPAEQATPEARQSGFRKGFFTENQDHWR